MGWLDVLKTVGGIAAAPFTGGTSLGLVIPELGKIASGIAGARAQGRQAAATTNTARDQLATQQYQTQQNAQIQSLLGAENANMNRANLGLSQAGMDLNQRKFALDAPNARAGQAVRGDMLNRSTAFRIPDTARIKVNHIQGGFNADMLSPETRQLGRVMTQQALNAQQKGDTFAPMSSDVPQQNWGGAVMKPPALSDLPQANGFDSFLNVASPLLGIGGAITSAFQQNKDQNLIDELLKQRPPTSSDPWQIPPVQEGLPDWLQAPSSRLSPFAPAGMR